MSTKNRDDSSVSLIEAVETLSSIADMDVGPELGIITEQDLNFQDKTLSLRKVHWLSKKNPSETMKIVKETFRVILKYLQHFYDKEYSAIADNKKIEGIKTIMVLVGEAAKKMDKYGQLFQTVKGKSIMELREYKQLQEFYLSRIAHKVDERTLGRWLLGITQQAWAKKPALQLVAEEQPQTHHVFVDLEAVKKDTEYELFLLRKEDGTRFYSPGLIRNIKLVCDFGDYFGSNKKSEDPLEDLQIWVEKAGQAAARTLLNSLGNRLSRFYSQALHFKDRELVELLNKALMALMLAANPQNVGRSLSVKSCRDYFIDFQTYLRQALHSPDYRKLIAYPPKNSSKFAHCLLDTLHGLCISLFHELRLFQILSPHIIRLINEAKENQSPQHEQAAKASKTLWNCLACDFAALNKLAKRHSNAPLGKILNVLRDGGRFAFDPIWQHDLPSQLYTLSFQDSKIMNLHLPSPTFQEFIHKAVVIDEFKAFVRGSMHEDYPHKHLLFNLQDRTSWKEHFRAVALEDLLKLDNFDKHLAVVTLPKDTEFYHQLAPYNHENHAAVFIQHFKDHLADINSGCFIPENLKKGLTGKFIDGTMDVIHRQFFSHKNVLTREQRMDFIEIFYLFLQLKLIELYKPDSFSLTCKDGVDNGATSNAALLAFMKLISPEKITEADRNQVNLVLHMPALMVRERIVQPERFNRILSALRSIEGVRQQHGEVNFAKEIREAFGEFYSTPILHAQIGY